ncbi:MAG: hypothetical protein IJV28_03775 [Paludibacteraceae bacterium]|nr:hypothetical protein [Paludibacteraceae bacterium]
MMKTKIIAQTTVLGKPYMLVKDGQYYVFGTEEDMERMTWQKSNEIKKTLRDYIYCLSAMRTDLVADELHACSEFYLAMGGAR